MTPPEVTSTDETSEQLSSGAALARRALHFWPAVLVALGFGAIAYLVFSRVRHPLFRSETVILYSESLRPDDDATRPDTTRSVTVRLKEILMSRASLEDIVQKFDLYPDIRRSQGAMDAGRGDGGYRVHGRFSFGGPGRDGHARHGAHPAGLRAS
jgi:hypothetical protein